MLKPAPPPDSHAFKVAGESSTAASDKMGSAIGRMGANERCCALPPPPEELLDDAKPWVKFTPVSRRFCCCSVFVIVGRSFASSPRKSPFSLPIVIPTSLACTTVRTSTLPNAEVFIPIRISEFSARLTICAICTGPGAAAAEVGGACAPFAEGSGTGFGRVSGFAGESGGTAAWTPKAAVIPVEAGAAGAPAPACRALTGTLATALKSASR